MTFDEFNEVAERGEWRTIRYNSTSKKARIDVYVYILSVDAKNVFLMDEGNRKIRLNYDKILDVV